MENINISRFCLGIVGREEIFGADALRLPAEIRRYFARQYADAEGKALFLTVSGEVQLCAPESLSPEEKNISELIQKWIDFEELLF